MVMFCNLYCVIVNKIVKYKRRKYYLIPPSLLTLFMTLMKPLYILIMFHVLLGGPIFQYYCITVRDGGNDKKHIHFDIMRIGASPSDKN
jgi:hypothetical protein